ncbi:MAG: DUF4340 domain-containing protein, partial [Planctomycetes bacterium]|nr:DUF4340 domain-containing protein [Planctomycetota bacterium]
MRVTNGLLLKLAVVAAALVAVTLAVYCRGEKAPGNFVPGAPLVQGLDVSQAAKIVVREKRANAEGYEVATLTAQADGAYAIAERHGYPADNEEINVLLRALLDIRTAVRLADAPDANPDFGVVLGSPATGDVAFVDKSGKEILKITVGAPAGRGHNVTIGRAVYRSEAPVDFRGSPLSYIDQTVFKSDSKKVKSLAIERPDGAKYSFIAKDGALKLAGVPDGKVENDEASWGVKEGFTGLMFDDVAPLEPEKAGTAALQKKTAAVVAMDDGAVYRLAIWQDKDGAYFATAAADEPARERLTPEKLMVWEKAVKYNRAHKGWRFAISKWDGERLDKPLSALLKDAPKPEAKTAAGPGATPPGAAA